MSELKIPKVLHYAWVGESEPNDLTKKCINSWKKYCPDYEIVLWDNKKFLEIKERSLYADQAYEKKQWAFVSDFILFYALYHYGGIFLDSDVEITRKLDDEFLKNSFFTSYQLRIGVYPLNAIVGSEPKNIISSDMLKIYYEIPFINRSNGKLDRVTNVVRFGEYCEKKFNLKKDYNIFDKTYLTKDNIIYPYYLFCNKERFRRNYSIHHFQYSWRDLNNHPLSAKELKKSIFYTKKDFLYKRYYFLNYELFKLKK
ncbi:Mannosyltransferase OCH1 protein [Candidatus Hepatincola sp. Pdp]